MQHLVPDKGSGDGIQAMRIENSKNVTGVSEVFTEDKPELLLIVAKSDTVWKIKDKGGDGSFMPAGMGYHVWLFKNEKIQVLSGELNISW